MYMYMFQTLLENEKSSIHRSDISERVTFSSCFNLLTPQTSGLPALGTFIPTFYIYTQISGLRKC